MSERDTYPAGVPCWVDTIQPDLERAAAFYGELFSWTFDGGMPMDGHFRYYLGSLRGREVAGIAPMPPMAPRATPGWVTQVRVESVEPAVRTAAAAGGTVVLESFDAAPAGRLGVVADPGGAVIGLWETIAREGAQRVNEPGAWAMSVVQSGDRARSAAFYRDVFGWTTESFGPDVTLFRLPGYVGGEEAQPVPRDVVAVMVPRIEGDADIWGVDFWVADVDATAARADELGGTVVRPVADSPAGRGGVLADPAGATFSVSQAPGVG